MPRCSWPGLIQAGDRLGKKRLRSQEEGLLPPDSCTLELQHWCFRGLQPPCGAQSASLADAPAFLELSPFPSTSLYVCVRVCLCVEYMCMCVYVCA
jgi:hypothetical protein